MLIYHCSCFEVNGFSVGGKGGLYAHTWHLAATALRLSLLPAEPSLTLPRPASSAG